MGPRRRSEASNRKHDTRSKPRNAESERGVGSTIARGVDSVCAPPPPPPRLLPFTNGNGTICGVGLSTLWAQIARWGPASEREHTLRDSGCCLHAHVQERKPGPAWPHSEPLVRNNRKLAIFQFYVSWAACLFSSSFRYSSSPQNNVPVFIFWERRNSPQVPPRPKTP